jgi:hypothetical protein
MGRTVIALLSVLIALYAARTFADATSPHDMAQCWQGKTTIDIKPGSRRI